MATRPQTRNRVQSRSGTRPSLRVVKGKKRKWSPVPIVVLVVLTVFSVAALQASLGQNGLKAAKLEHEVSKESERLTLLHARTAQLSNASRVADEAGKLGLVGDPDPVHLKVTVHLPGQHTATQDITASKRLDSGNP